MLRRRKLLRSNISKFCTRRILGKIILIYTVILMVWCLGAPPIVYGSSYYLHDSSNWTRLLLLSSWLLLQSARLRQQSIWLLLQSTRLHLQSTVFFLFLFSNYFNPLSTFFFSFFFSFLPFWYFPPVLTFRNDEFFWSLCFFILFLLLPFPTVYSAFPTVY